MGEVENQKMAIKITITIWIEREREMDKYGKEEKHQKKMIRRLSDNALKD